MMIFSYRRIFQLGLLILLACVVLIGLFWGSREYRQHAQAMQQVQDAYVALRKAEVKTIVDQLIEEIEFHKAEVEQRLKENIMDKVRMAVNTAWGIYESERHRHDDAEIKQLIIDTLMPLRFFDGRGYYWIHDTDHVLIAHPSLQSSVGKDDSQTVDIKGQFFVQDFVQTALANTDGGFVSYYWSKPEIEEQYQQERGQKKIAYLQLFEPYNWVIGVGEYVDDVEEQTQAAMIRRIASVSFGEAGYIFNHDRNGVCLNHVNEEVIGQDRWELLDATGMKLVQELDRVGRQPGGRFLEYVATIDPRTGEPAKKLSFVRSVDDWGWVLGAGVYLEDIEAWLAEMNADVAQQLRARIIALLAGFGMFVGLLLLAMQRLMGRFARELEYFVSAGAAEETKPLDLDRFRIAELRAIAERSNTVLKQKAKVQEQLYQAQKMESIGILAGGVAHDFNNLLHAMRGHIELLLQGKSEDHPDARRLLNVTKSMDRAAQLVQQLLLFSRKIEAHRMRVDVNQEVEDVARMLERTIPRMVAIELRLDPSVWPIFADPVQIEQVLLNLASNAVDAMPDGGTLMMETKNMVMDEAFVMSHPGSTAGLHVLLTVTDTGCGMDRDVLEHIFDPFFTTKNVGKGTGLGLASVYGIVKAHGGYIHCYSEPGLGTTFQIYLPAAEQGEGLVNEDTQKTTLPSGQENILVVDDESEIRELTREALEILGYSVRMAASGEQALKIYQEHDSPIDLVLLDLNMPGMGGYRCLQELLQIDPSVKIIIASGYSASGHGKDALASGSKGFIGKPYQLKELAAMVREVLDEKE